MAKVIYFTAGDVPTTAEQADIAALSLFAVAPFEIAVRNTKAVGASGVSLEAADYVACVSGGTLPALYDDAEDFAVFDPANPPVGGLPATSAIVANGGTVATVKNSAESVTKSATATVAGGVITKLKLASTVALVTHNDTKTGVTGAGANTVATISVAAGVISAISCAAP
jgi:hypothetical protein